MEDARHGMAHGKGFLDNMPTLAIALHIDPIVPALPSSQASELPNAPAVNSSALLAQGAPAVNVP